MMRDRTHIAGGHQTAAPVGLMRRAALLFPLLAWPGIAAAANGLLTLVVGIPMLLCLSVVLGFLLPLRTRKPVRIASLVLAVPALAYSVFIAIDAARLLRTIGSENSMIGLAFFALMLLSCLLLFLVMRGRSAAR